MKPITFLGSSLKALRAFTDAARQDAGFQLDLVQHGQRPDDFKPMPAVGAGLEELRVWCEQGTFRVVYLARLADAIFVPHAFQKKTRTTAKADIEIATRRYRQLIKGRP